MAKRLESSFSLTKYAIISGTLSYLSCFEIEFDNGEINAYKGSKIIFIVY
jgi:hypothetical protein